MAKYLKSGNTIRVCRDDEIDVRDKLPVGTYAVKFDKQSEEFFLQRMEDFKMPPKTYGDVSSISNRILTTFRSRHVSTGVCLAGTKGSGKTLITKMVSILAAKEDISTIVVAEEFHGDTFNKFIQDIAEEALVVFDEFEKQYTQSSQEKLLTLLDGVYVTKKLFILTCNNSYRVDDNLKNRPGRIFYSLEFKGIDATVVSDYCDDVLKDKQYKQEIIEILGAFPEFTFDMLQALVEEMNRYNESPTQALTMLNIKIKDSSSATYDIVKVVYKDKTVPKENIETKSWTGNPLKFGDWNNLEVYFNIGDDKNYIEITEENIAGYDRKRGEYTYISDVGDTVVIRLRQKTEINPLAF